MASPEQLEEYISKRMRMSHIYQPVMLKTVPDTCLNRGVSD
jgi:hypothetical protein